MGSFQEGSLTGESGNTTIFLQTGDQVSLHLARHQVAGYESEGSNLIVKLADGREIVLSDYFSGDAGDQPHMLKKKVVALIEVTRARKVLADAQVKLDEILTYSELELANEYSDTLKELATLRQNLRASQDQFNRTVLQSPMRNVSVTTIGGVVRPGEEILQIIPLDEELFVEARVKPENIENIRPGQEATIKLSAYDYIIFGTLKGRVDVISADTFKDERSRAEDGNTHYKVRVRVDMWGLTDKHARIEIRPGMQAQVALYIGEKTVLQYLLKPLYKSREAFREP
jgi:adhesin transport system membrane fusion protein